MKLFYLISSSFDYDKLILGDAGPAFADDYGILSGSLASNELDEADVVIVDNRFNECEFQELGAFIRCTRSLILLRVVDPYWPRHSNDPWYRFVWDHIDRDRIHLLLAYSHAEITGLFASIAQRSQLLWAPYVYREECEIPLNHSNRYHALALSGASDPSIYPLRKSMKYASQLWPGFWFRTRRLKHPGYPDIGQKLTHKVLGGDYVKWLGNHKFAFVCSSRCRIEFLKYREIAYAGCLPVGDLPASLLDCPNDAFVSYRRNWRAFSKSVFKSEDSEARSFKFRMYMKARRKRESMIHMLNESIRKLF